MENRIKEYREAKGLSVRGLGKQIGVAGQTVNGWEHGRSLPRPKTRAVLADLFGCSLDDLFPNPEEVLTSRGSVTSALKFLSEYKLTVGDVSPEVTIRLYEDLFQGNIHFIQSHFIKTPEQTVKYVSENPTAETEKLALSKAVNTLVRHYDLAVDAGLEPEEGWFVRNENFNDFLANY